jgi:diguanylate cyclase (GGDEF)-like protein
LPGKCWVSGQPLWAADLSKDNRVLDPGLAVRVGMRGTFALPVISDGRSLGVMVFSGQHVLEPDPGLLAAVQVIAIQVGQYLRRRQAERALENTERFAKSTLDSLAECICVLDDGGIVVNSNRAWREFGQSISGGPVRGWDGVDYLAECARVTGADAAAASAFADGIRDVISGRRKEFRMDYACDLAGVRQWFRGRVTRFAGGGPVRVVVTHENITERRNAEQSMHVRATQQSLIAAFGRHALGSSCLDDIIEKAAAIAATGLGAEFSTIARFGLDGRSATLKAGLGWQEGWIGRRIAGSEWEINSRCLQAPTEPVIVADYLEQPQFPASPMLKLHGIRSSVDVPIAGAQGRLGILGVYSTRPNAFAPASVDFLLSLANTLAAAIERGAADEQLTQLAQFDTLTGLPNRSLFQQRLEQALEAAFQRNAQAGVLIADLDRFKRVNDTLGHGAGDRLLAQMARRLAACVRPGDTVGRLGGDEFAFILGNLESADEAAAIAKKLIDSLGEPFALEGRSIYISCSIGIGIYPADSTDAGTLMKHADSAMYRAKAQGRNTFRFYLPQMSERAAERLHLESELHNALERGEFFVRFQPKLELASGAITGFEALLRWQHPQRGEVEPGEFIATLEDTGLIVPVGAWVMRTVCHQLVHWRNAGVAPRPIAVNLSARQFQQPNLDGTVGAILEETGADPTLLELEITESMLMDPEIAGTTLRKLKARGVRLSIDDFGTGYSSLSYLKKFPLDALKIDRAFVRDTRRSPKPSSSWRTV